jgi:hypothetical protein
MPESFERNLPE